MASVSIIIPAHNESAVIGRCLRTLLQGALPGELQIVVVANGCTDDTANQARSVDGAIQVIDTPTPGKWNAINLGDAAATAFPRFYIDADVHITVDAIRKVAQVLHAGKALAAAPRVDFDLADHPWSVRAFYDIWLRTPYMVEGMIGSGVYAVSEAGRKRWDQLPNLTADDAFVRLHFTPAERMIVQDCTFTIHPPRTLASLVKIKTRGHFGNLELKRMRPALFENEGEPHGQALSKLAIQPGLWAKLAIYLGVRLISRKRAMNRLRHGDHKTWERDDSSRNADAPAKNRP